MSQEDTGVRHRLLIGGEWHDGEDLIVVTDLADGGVFAEVPAATAEQAEAALEAAHDAKRRMRETSILERVGWLRAIADGIDDRSTAFAETIVREAGKPISSAQGEVEATVERFRLAIDEARDLNGEYRVGYTDAHPGWEATYEPEPIGTVLCITPFNYPLATPALRVAPALAAGNSVILKPATDTPVATAMLAEVIADVGLPAGGFNYVSGQSRDIGDVLVGDDRINAIAMTGSSGAGKHVAAESKMVTLHMELGGNAPAIVFPDADLELAADECTWGTLNYAGQRCSAVSRILAHADVHDELVAAIDERMDEWVIGDLFDEETQFNPLINDEQADHVEELVADAIEHGGTLVRGGERDGTVFAPTLLSDLPHDARIIDEEQFGPVAPVTAFADEEEAIAIANASDLALDGCVFTADHDRALSVARRIDAGAVRINGAPEHGIGDIPFGGNKDSGISREGIGTTIERFVRHRSVIL